MATKLLITSEQAFCFKPCSVAIAFIMAPFVIAFLLVFIDFMGGSMVPYKGAGMRGQTENSLHGHKAFIM